jgi:AAA+ ATPase superfamily predicted ATPase
MDQDDEGRIDANRGFKGKDLPALSIRNEKKCLLRMKIECEKLLKGYPTTLDEDLELIEKDAEGHGPNPLTESQRNSVLMRSGEKKVLKYLSDTASIIIPLMDKNLQDLKKELKKLNLTED